MKTCRFTEQQIVGSWLKQGVAGMSVRGVGRQSGFSVATFFK